MNEICSKLTIKTPERPCNTTWDFYTLTRKNIYRHIVCLPSRLTEELKSSGIKIECWAKAQYSRRECLEITGIISSSVSDKDLDEVVCKVVTEAGVDINADDVENCHRVGNKGQTIIKFSKRKVSRQVLSVRKDLNKVKMSNIDLRGKVHSI